MAVNEFFVMGIVALVAIMIFCATGIIQEELTKRSVRSQLRAPLLHE
jgi:hypothetical protein